MELYYILIIYILIALVVGFEGHRRDIGFLSSFVVSLVMTPLVGIGITGLFKRKIAISRFIKTNECEKCRHPFLDGDDHCENCGNKEIWKQVA